MSSTVFNNLPTDLYSNQAIRAMDQTAQSAMGISGYRLMQRAGEACFENIQRSWPKVRTLSVLCGTGNNAGDGFVIAHLAQKAGWDVRAYPVGDTATLTGDALTAFTAYRDNGGALLTYIPEGFENAEVLVDALLGSGLNRPVDGHYAAIIEATRRFRGKIFSVDVPSGLCSDSGVVMGHAIRADITLTFIALKPGLFTGAGPEYAGSIAFCDLGLPPELRLNHPIVAQRIRMSQLHWPTRMRHAHKGHCGHVLIIGGDQGFAGAVRLCGEAAARSGTGLVSIATHTSHAAVIACQRPELMCHGIEDAMSLQPLIKRASVIAIGPGLGTSIWAQTLLAAALESQKPLVIDADALNLLAEYLPARSYNNWILTPHPGEAARLLGLDSAAQVENNRLTAVRQIQKQYGGIAVLKGAGTLIKGQDTSPIQINSTGNPGMASGGMGDVLTGIIAALIAQGLSLEQAACTGVWHHGAAADLAATSEGSYGLLASDVIAALRATRPH